LRIKNILPDQGSIAKPVWTGKSRLETQGRIVCGGKDTTTLGRDTSAPKKGEKAIIGCAKKDKHLIAGDMSQRGGTTEEKPYK